ncbi:MAG: M12 family metallo-peptidase, partial [Bacteroidota bacterium]
KKQDQLQKLLSTQFTDYQIYQVETHALNAYVKEKKTEIHLRLQFGSQYSWEMQLLDNDIRSPEYKVQVATETGVIAYPRGENKSFMAFPNHELGRVRLTIDDEFIYGFVEEGGETYYIEPLWYFDKKAATDLFVVYAASDVIPDKTKTCGLDHDHSVHEKKHHDLPDVVKPGVGNPPLAEMMTCFDVEIAIASDWLMWQDYGGMANLENRNIGVMNAVQADYDDEFNWELNYVIVTQFFSSCSTCDPWTASTAAGTLLGSFRSWGNGGGFGVTYDVAQLWTDRNYNGSTVGIAYLSGVCNFNRYHANQDYTGNANSIRQLTSHELGHNFGSGHDAGGSPCIMAPAINGSSCWSAASQNVINNFTSGLINGCLAPCSAGVAPTALFSADVTDGCVPLTVNYFDASLGATSWSWTFEGGTPATSTDQNPTVTYLTQGV